MNVVILAAGMGTRLGRPQPKPLTLLADGRSMVRRQIDLIGAEYGPQAPILVVVGYKMSQVVEACCERACFVYNELYDQTNTSQSLRRGLRLAAPGGVLWFNADVVFEPGLLGELRAHLAAQTTFVAVSPGPVGAEEVKYTLDPDGFIAELSKQADGLGEAVGINYVSAADRPLVLHHLDRCAEDDYFEQGLQEAVQRSGLRIRAVDVGAYGCVEVDTSSDLGRANQVAQRSERKPLRGTQRSAESRVRGAPMAAGDHR